MAKRSQTESAALLIPHPSSEDVGMEAEAAALREKSEASKRAVAPRDYSDWAFGASFFGAAFFGIANAINTIRHNFYESFVKPPAGLMSLTEVTDKEAAEKHSFAQIFRDRKRGYEDLTLQKSMGKISGVEQAQKKIDITVDAERKISDLCIKEYGIHTRGWRGWTTDVWKQRNHVGTFARRQATFTMATTTLVTVGAVATLKYAKHLLDRIDQNEKQQEEFLVRKER
jgi:hypothetical protein